MLAFATLAQTVAAELPALIAERRAGLHQLPLTEGGARRALEARLREIEARLAQLTQRIV